MIGAVDQYIPGAGLLVLIMVTDEAGEKVDEHANLAEAMMRTSRNVRLYVLGREAVFGQRRQLIEISNPAFDEENLAYVDRGPETCYVEQLQHSPFEKLDHTYSSGYGPYAQSMLVQQTGGKFYLIPDTLNGNVVHREKNFKNNDLYSGGIEPFCLFRR